MNNIPQSRFDDENQILTQIHKGMEVVDSEGRKVGTVEFVQMSSGDVAGRGAATPSGVEERSHTLLDDFAEAFSLTDELSDTVKSRLLFSGFVRMDSKDLFRADRHILPDQIDQVSGDVIHLKSQI